MISSIITLSPMAPSLVPLARSTGHALLELPPYSLKRLAVEAEAGVGSQMVLPPQTAAMEGTPHSMATFWLVEGSEELGAQVVLAVLPVRTVHKALRISGLMRQLLRLASTGSGTSLAGMVESRPTP
jgi:hypothetical protein